MNKKILILSGDPNSINSEIIFKSWSRIKGSLKKKIYFISNYNLLNHQAKKINMSSKMVKTKGIYELENDKRIKVIDLNLEFNNPFKVSKKDASKFIRSSLNLAHKLAKDKNVNGFINCAIDKKLLGTSNFGVTEYLASKCNIKNNSEVMLIKNNNLAVSPITTHINVTQISKKLKKSVIIKKIKTIDLFFRKFLKKKPKIAMLGLNPHNSELKKKSQEYRIIIPAIKKLRKSKIKVTGPYAADTIFMGNHKNYDVIVGMYHDQVLAPFKALYKFDAINITLGLNYLRASPDHGTAYNLIGKNKANPLSLIKCIDFLNI